MISLFNLYGFAVSNGHQDMIYAAVFILVGYLTTFFSKNMIVILFCALTVANILKYGLEIRVQDGFTTNDDSTETDKKPDINQSGETTDKTVTVKEEKPTKEKDEKLSKEDKPEKKEDKPEKKEDKPDKNAEKPIDIKSMLKTSTDPSDMMDQVQKMTAGSNISDMRDQLKKALTVVNDNKEDNPGKTNDYKHVLNVQLELLDKINEITPLITKAKSAMSIIKKYDTSS